MKSVCKSLMLGLLLGVATLIPGQVQAQIQPKPAVVVSIANLNEQLKDIKYLLTASGFPEFNFLAKAAIKGYADGLDFTRNAGISLYFEGDKSEPNFSAFVPIEDLELFLDVISGFADVEENGDDGFTLALPNGTEIHVKANDGYAFFANKSNLLNVLPAEPEQMLGDKPTKYNLAFDVRPQAVPQALRDKVLAIIKSGSEQTLDKLDDELMESQQKSLAMQMRQFEMILNESESLTIGMAANAETKKLYTDIEFTAKAGSELAKKHNESEANRPSRFSGFMMQDSAMNFGMNGQMLPADGITYDKLLKDGKKAVVERMNESGELSDAEFEKIETLLDSVAEVLGETLKQGVVDTGVAMMLEGQDANLVGGVASADPAKVEAAVKDLIPLLKERLAADDNPDIPSVVFNLDKENHNGIRFHEIVVTLDNVEARNLFGDSVSVLIGFGKDSVYYGFGTGPMQPLKKAMAAKGKSEFSAEMNLHVAPFLRMAARTDDAPPEIAAMAEQLSENGGDLMRAYSKHVPNGIFTRLEMQDGILSLIKSGYETAQGGFDNDF